MLKDELLTPKEKEIISNLRPGFNIVKESTHPLIVASRRIEISRKWAKRLLRASLILNVISIVCFILGGIFVLLKPQPDYYASTPSGKIVGPLPKYHPKN